MLPLSERFGERLRNERIRLCLTQEELANKAGVRPLTIIQYEKGKSSPPVKFIYLLKDIGFDISYLMLDAVEVDNLNSQPPEYLKEIADALDLLELKLGDTFSNEEKVKLIAIMLRQLNLSTNKKEFSFKPKELITNLIKQII